MAAVPKVPWRAVALIAATSAMALLIPASIGVRIVVAAVFAVALLFGARYRQLQWALEPMPGAPPIGGEWSGALCASAGLAVVLRLFTDLDFGVALISSLSLCHAFAKVSCDRNGCCRWRRSIWFREGQIIDSGLSLAIATLLVIVATFGWMNATNASALAGSLCIMCRALSMYQQRRPVIEAGGIALFVLTALSALPASQT